MVKFPKTFLSAAAMQHLSAVQRERVETWMQVQKAVCNGNFGVEFDAFFHEKMGYRDLNRPDVTTYKNWKRLVVEFHRFFRPRTIHTSAATALSDQEIWVHCYYRASRLDEVGGVEGHETDIEIESFSIINFDQELIAGIRTLSSDLQMLIALGKVPNDILRANDYADFHLKSPKRVPVI